ncbi:methyl-accepting chemotaxis protein, partial [Pseudomonas syringae pv. tagetis]
TLPPRPPAAPLASTHAALSYSKGQTPTYNTLALPQLAAGRDWDKLSRTFGDRLMNGAQVVTRDTGQQIAPLVFEPTLRQVFEHRFSHYAVAVFVLW